jgi:ribonuclease G
MPAPATLHVDESLPLRMLRDAPREGVERIVFDDEETYERARAWIAPLDATLAARLRLHPHAGRLFEAEGVDAELDRALRPRVWLKSGGTIVIEPTEALVSIDVNTGKFVGSRRAEDTVLKTNLEAADEIARQLRLRDLGGIIVIDFIDMDRAESRRQVLSALESALHRDRSRTKVVGLSELGLVELTRKRTRAGIAAHVSRTCPTCYGHGRVKSPVTLAGEALAETRRLAEAFPEGDLTIRAHPDVARAVRLALQDAGPSVEAAVVARVRVEDDPGARPDTFDVIAL